MLYTFVCVSVYECSLVGMRRQGRSLVAGDEDLFVSEYRMTFVVYNMSSSETIRKR